MVIVGAGVIRVYRNRVSGGWVPYSLDMWQSDLKGKDACYHRKFTAEVFESWFGKLCLSLQ